VIETNWYVAKVLDTLGKTQGRDKMEELDKV
jgi:hypothetical protein